MEFKEIASISGKGGLYKILKPTRAGVIIESIDDTKHKSVASASNRVSILQEISVYTTTQEGSTPLENVLRNIHEEFKGDTGLSATSDGDELKSFLKHIVPEYDPERVYVSDIKKIINWYNILFQYAPETFDAKPTEDPKSEKEEKPKEEKAEKSEIEDPKAASKEKKTEKESPNKPQKK